MPNKHTDRSIPCPTCGFVIRTVERRPFVLSNEDSHERQTPERGRALRIAAAVLDRPNADPDDDIAVLARQLERAQEEIENA